MLVTSQAPDWLEGRLVRLSQMAANARSCAREEVSGIRDREPAQFPKEDKGNKKCDCPSLTAGAKILFLH